jgi:hypothetical protein
VSWRDGAEYDRDVLVGDVRVLVRAGLREL